MLKDDSHRRLPVRLLERTPGCETGSRTGPQHTVEFPQRASRIVKKHHAETARCQIKAAIPKRDFLCVGLAETNVRKSALLSPAGSNLQQLGTEIERSHVPACPDLFGDADRRLAGAAGE